jgi:hypothetical protein
MRIKLKNISIVVQGNVIRKNDNIISRNGGKIIKENNNWNRGTDITKECLDSVRKSFPKSKIILSTYIGSDIKGLDYDELVLIKDPGAEGEVNYKQPNNINRIVKTSIEGIKKVKTKYCLKIRTDALIENIDFLNEYKKWGNISCKNKKYKLFSKRILANGLLTANPDKLNIPYSLNDWFFLGKTKDLYFLFDIPLFNIKAKDFIEDRQKLKKAGVNLELGGNITPEQYVFYNAILKKNKDVSLKHFRDCSGNNLYLSIQYFINNFVFVEGFEYGIIHKKNDVVFKEQLPYNISNKVFVDLYNKYNFKNNWSSAEEITVVVQGAIDKEKTPICLLSLRRYLPDAKIILSTWKNSDLSNLKSLYDEVVLSKDPGNIIWWKKNKGGNKKNINSNINRQIVSTVNGIKKAETKYVLKFRTDFALNGNNFINYFDKYNEYDSKYKLVKKRVLLWNLYTRNPYIKHDFPYHYSDIVMFGLKEDLLNIWDIPLCPNDDFINKGKTISTRYMPEQYVWLSFFRKYKNIKCARYYTLSRKIKNESMKYMVNNIVLLNNKQFGLNILKKDILNHNTWTCYSNKDWLTLYRKQNNKVCLSCGYIWLKIKENYKIIFLLPICLYYVWRKFIKIIACLIPNRKLRHMVRKLY